MRLPDAAVAGLLVALLLRLGFAARWDPLADEAYHWAWSLAPSWGYYDQPPMIAWTDALGTALLGHRPLALRAGGILLSGAAVLALLPFAKDRALLVRWLAGLPPLAWLGSLGVPDAWLLGWWGLALAMALRGGRAWLLAGLFGGLAALSKHDGALLLPLCLLGADAAERRTPWPWLGLGLSALVLSPNVAWLAANGFVTLRFQLAEGLLNEHPPGLLGPVRVVLEQALLVGPLGAAAVVVAWWGALPGAVVGSDDRTGRIALAASLPVFLLFLAASVGGPPEAHWPAPAWIGAGVLVARTSGRAWRLAALGSWLGVAASLLLAVHVERPLVRLPTDPAARFGEGRVLADAVARRTLPLGVAPWEPGAHDVGNVASERYQEASLIRWFTGIPARVWPGCGRRSQDDLGPPPAPTDVLFYVRPSRGRPPGCLVPPWTVEETQRVRGKDDRGRQVGPWDLVELREEGG